MTTLDKIIKHCDIYGDHYSMKINGSSKFKTVSGGMFSLITIGFLIFTIISFGQDFVRRDNPQTSFEEKFDPKLNFINITESANEDKTIVLIASREEIKNYFVGFVSFSFYSLAYTANALTECDNNYLSSVNVEKNELLKYFCFYFNDIQSIYTEEELSNLSNKQLVISECKDAIKKYNLKDSDLQCSYKESSNYENNTNTISSTFLNLRFLTPKIYFNSENYKDPLEEFKKEKRIALFNNQRIFTTFRMRNFELFDFKNWITNLKTKSSKVEIFNIDVQQEFQVTHSELQVNFIMETNFIRYYRNYQKIQHLIALIGGFMKAIVMIVNSVNKIWKNYSIDMHFIFTYFKIYDEQEELNHYENRQSFINSKSKRKQSIKNNKEPNNSNSNSDKKIDKNKLKNNNKLSVHSSTTIIGFNHEEERDMSINNDDECFKINNNKNKIGKAKSKQKVDKFEVTNRIFQHMKNNNDNNFPKHKLFENNVYYNNNEVLNNDTKVIQNSLFSESFYDLNKKNNKNNKNNKINNKRSKSNTKPSRYISFNNLINSFKVNSINSKNEEFEDIIGSKTEEIKKHKLRKNIVLEFNPIEFQKRSYLISKLDSNNSNNYANNNNNNHNIQILKSQNFQNVSDDINTKNSINNGLNNNHFNSLISSLPVPMRLSKNTNNDNFIYGRSNIHFDNDDYYFSKKDEIDQLKNDEYNDKYVFEDNIKIIDNKKSIINQNKDILNVIDEKINCESPNKVFQGGKNKKWFITYLKSAYYQIIGQNNKGDIQLKNKTNDNNSNEKVEENKKKNTNSYNKSSKKPVIENKSDKVCLEVLSDKHVKNNIDKKDNSGNTKKFDEEEELFKRFQTASEICDFLRSVNYLQDRMLEFELLKGLLLNENQILALSLAEKPYLNKNNKEHAKQLIKQYSFYLADDNEKEQLVVDYFVDLFMSKRYNELLETDYKLFNSLKKNLRREIFEKVAIKKNRKNNEEEDNTDMED